MNFLIGSIVTYILFYRYLAIFLVAFLAATIVPIPSGSILMGASAFASQGYFNIYWVVILSIIGNILGDNLGYFLARKYGRRTLSRIGFRTILESKEFSQTERKFKKNPELIIFLSRFEVLATLSVNLLSGMSNISYRKFLVHEVAGSVAQVCVYAFVGYYFGNNWEHISNIIGDSFFIAFCLGVILLTIFRKRIMNYLATE